MLPVKQTLDDNCFQACLASLLEMSIDSIPTAAIASSWDWDSVVEWAESLGYFIIEFSIPHELYCPPILVIGNGASPRDKKLLHSVVGNLTNGQFVTIHDPHPSNAGILDLKTITFMGRLQ